MFRPLPKFMWVCTDNCGAGGGPAGGGGGGGGGAVPLEVLFPPLCPAGCPEGGWLLPLVALLEALRELS